MGRELIAVRVYVSFQDVGHGIRDYCMHHSIRTIEEYRKPFGHLYHVDYILFLFGAQGQSVGFYPPATNKFEAHKMISFFAFDCRWLPNRSRTCHAATGMILYHCGDQPASSSVCPFLWWPLHVKREYYERLTKLNARCINWHWILQQHFRSVRLVAESNASAYEWHCEIGHGPLHRRLCTGWLFRLCCIQQSDFLRQRNVVFLNIAG